MSTEIFDLSEEQIVAIAGGSQIDPPATAAMADDYPQIENNPPA